MYPAPNYPYPPQTPPEPPEPKYRFRWTNFLLIVLVIGAVLFILNGIEPSFEIPGLLDRLGVAKQNRYIRMLCLMVVGIAILLIVKLFREKSD